MRFVTAFLRFWWEFVVGDEWRIAAGVAAALFGGALLVSQSSLSDTSICTIVALAIFGTVAVTVVASSLKARKAARGRTS